MNIDKKTIRRRALELIAADGRGVGPKVAQQFGVSRQVANGYLQAMTNEGLIEAEGSTRARVYRLIVLDEAQQTLPRMDLQEDMVWRDVFLPKMRDLPENVRDIWHYAITEMINNAIDHSGADKIDVSMQRNGLFAEASVSDDGVGIFLKIQKAFNLFDTREAILELAKGKLTTAPEHHSGEGVFFTSRMMDAFDIRSGALHFHHEEHRFDVLTEKKAAAPGTLVRMRLDNDSARTLRELFDAFADQEDYTFDRTIVPLRLAQHEGEKLVSRSQAKRIAHRLERFKRVELDFTGVEAIGQAFADEMFRVFVAAHSQIRLTPTNTSPTVANMIRRAVGAGDNEHQEY